MIHSNNIYVGIDIAKFKIDVAFSHNNKVITYDYNKPGLKKLLKVLKEIEPTLVCFEATGVLPRVLMRELQLAGHTVSMVNPRQIRDFARAQNKLAKTDKIDARNIALFAEIMNPRISEFITDLQYEMQDLTACRNQLTKTKTQTKCRLSSAPDKNVQRSHKRHLTFLEKEIKWIDQRREKLIAENAEMQELLRLLVSAPSIGFTTAAALIAALPELGQLNRKEIARLVGVAPTNRDSGTMRGKRTIGGGRASIRYALYMPTLNAIQRNPKIKKFYERLLKKGKPKMVAVMASMRKFLTILNAMVKEQKHWDTTMNNA